MNKGSYSVTLGGGGVATLEGITHPGVSSPSQMVLENATLRAYIAVWHVKMPQELELIAALRCFEAALRARNGRRRQRWQARPLAHGLVAFTAQYSHLVFALKKAP